MSVPAAVEFESPPPGATVSASCEIPKSEPQTVQRCDWSATVAWQTGHSMCELATNGGQSRGLIMMHLPLPLQVLPGEGSGLSGAVAREFASPMLAQDRLYIQIGPRPKGVE